MERCYICTHTQKLPSQTMKNSCGSLVHFTETYFIFFFFFFAAEYASKAAVKIQPYFSRALGPR